jgi:protein gp37
MKPKGNPIGWCDKTANPVIGCKGGCEYCYARGMNDRFKFIPDFSKPEFRPNALKEFRTKEPMIIFIDSMSDIGYWQPDWYDRVYTAMAHDRQNIYLALTKRYEVLYNLQSIRRRFDGYIHDPEYRPRFYIGATITNNAQAQAVIDAGGADFISFEPLMERIRPELLEQLKCKWWIIGDLTKNGKPQGVTRDLWVCDMGTRAINHSIPFFMKDSLRDLMEECFTQQFPEGWKTHKHAETEVHNYAE